MLAAITLVVVPSAGASIERALEVTVALPVRTGPVLLSLSLAVVVVGLDTTILNVALPTISSDLGASTSQLQWIVDAYLLAVVAVMLPGGLLGDRFGRRRVLLAGLALFLAGSVWAAASTTIASLMAARAVQGLGAAVIVPLALALVAAAAWGCWRAVPESTSPSPVHLDAPGAALSTAGLLALVYALVGAPAAGWLSARTLLLVLVAVVLAAAFVARLRWARHPLIEPAMVTDRRFALGCVAVMGASGALLAALFVIPQYLQGVAGYGHLGVGLATLPLMVGLLVAGAASSRLQQHLGPRALITAALLVLAAGLATCAAVDPSTPYVVLGAGLAVVGAGIGAAVAPGMDVAMTAAGDGRAGSASAVINTARQLAGAIAVAVLGSLLAATYARSMSPAVADLPAPLAGAATASLAGADAAAASLGAGGAELRDAAGVAFATSMSAVMTACAVGAAVCALLLATLLRGQAGGPAATVDDEPAAAPVGMGR